MDLPIGGTGGAFLDKAGLGVSDPFYPPEHCWADDMAGPGKCCIQRATTDVRLCDRHHLELCVS